MNKIISDFFKSIITFVVNKIKLTIYIATIFGLLIVTLLYIFNPLLPGGNTYITLDDNIFSFKVPANTNKIQLYFQIPPLKIQHTIIPFTNNKSDTFHTKIEFNEFTNTDTPQEKILTIIPKRNQFRKYTFNQYTINIKYKSQIPKPTIYKIFIDDKLVDNSIFFENNISTNTTTYVNRNYIRNDATKIIYEHNDAVSNYILSFLTFSVVPLSIFLVIMMWRFHISGQNTFDRYILGGNDFENVSENEALTNIKYDFSIKYSNYASTFRLLKSLGPAIGFALTVSSLISSLNPSSLNNEDLTEFFYSIQIAMVSTFIGLIIRILAIVSQRYNSMILNRADERFSLLEKK